MMGTMNPVAELRGLLAQFQRSDWKDLYFRNADWAVFMARPDGAANPMRAADFTDLPEQAPEQVEAIRAPHLGLFVAGIAVGAEVAPGTILGALQVLDRRTDVLSEHAGRLVAVTRGEGELVEYGDVLFEIAA